MRDDARAVRRDRRHVGLRLAADVLPDGGGHRRGDRAAPTSASRHSANSDGPEPDRLQPSAPASTAACLIAPGPARAARGAARRSCPRATATSESKSPRCSASTNAPRFAHCWMASAERHRVAEQRARRRGLDFEIGMDDDGRQPGRHRQPDDVGRIRRRGPARSRRRSPARCCRACAEPAPRRSPSSAQAISVSSGVCAPSSASTATTAAAALAALPPRPLDSGSPLRIVERDAAPLAERRQQRLRGDAGGVARRLARQPAVVADDVVDAARRAGAEAARSPRRPARRARSRARRTRTRRSTRSPAQRRSQIRIGHACIAVSSAMRSARGSSGSRYSRNARSKSYVGSKPQSRARRGIVHVRRPRIDDPLPLRVDLVRRSRASGNAAHHDVADLARPTG